MSGMNPAYTIYRLAWKSLDLVFPPVCGGCQREGSRWCKDCVEAVKHIPEPICDHCGTPLINEDLCSECRTTQPNFRMLRSWSVFEYPVRNALHRLKYRRDVGLGDSLAAQMCEYVKSLQWPINLIVPVPLGQKRFQERGYNQVGLIARPLSLAMGIHFAPTALTRIRDTVSQVGLSRTERQQNVCGAFQAEGSRVKGQVILLMDDVATTGSTLSSCADALYHAGAQDVFALTVARALVRQQRFIA